ncbi:hypothetical protein Tco_0312042 [Tanacetum coccineum]
MRTCRLLDSTSGFQMIWYMVLAPCSTAPLSIGPFEMKDYRATKRAADKLYQPIFLTLGASVLFCQKKNGHFFGCALTIGIKQTDSEEPLSTPRIDELFDHFKVDVYSKIDLRRWSRDMEYLSQSCDRDPRFASNFWRTLQNALGTSLYEYCVPSINRRAKREDHSNSRGYAAYFYHASIKAAPFEALYGRKCRSPVCWTEIGEAQILGPELIQETTEKIIQISKDASDRDRQRVTRSEA